MAAATAAATVDYSRLKLLCILEGPGAAVLSHVLNYGTKKTASVTLLDYLINLPYTSTANYLTLNGEQKRRAFTRTEKNQMANDPLCQSFDIILLHKCIRLACENVAELNDTRWQDDNVMEGLVTKIKAERNECVHERPQMTDEQHFMEKISDLKILFNRSLQAVKDKYGVSDPETTNIRDNITRQMEDILQAFTGKVILQMDFNKRLCFFKDESVSHLRKIYKQFEYFDPLSFLSGSQEERVHIQPIFSKLILKEQPKNLDIDCLDLLKVLTTEPQGPQPSQPVQDQRPRLAIVSGIAGSGKTTLLTFMLSEWLKEECDRRIKHLEEYDIVLRILCRDTDAEDLETFLGLVLPSSLSVFNEPLVNYLKHCKVLFLIDGLDELNSTTEKLINNILNTTKYNRNFFILAASRPERVDQFLARTRQDYKQSQITIEGIPVSRRMEFVLQYSTSTNQDRLRKFMKKQGNMTLFELPLNLLFLVTLFEDNPDCITTKITQSSLYTHIHEWCTEKLHHRISVHPTWGKNELEETLRTRIKRVLKEVYQLALQGLLQDRLSLSDEDTKWLADYCKREDLPSHQVLGAFFTLRLSIINRIVKRKYYTPHKGLLEYFAARHIMQCLHDESLPGPGAIRSLLQGTAQPQTQPLDLRSLRNLFWHVAGLLSIQEAPTCPETIKEVIDMLSETGAKWNEWLSLVEDTDYNESFLQGIAHHVTENPPRVTVRIRDNTLASAAALLPRTPATTMELWLDNEKVNVENVRALIDHQCHELSLHHHYKHPGNTCASDTVLRAIDRSRLKEFTGHLSADCVALLPEPLKQLHLAVSSDEHAGSLLAALTQAASSLPNLQRLHIHVPVAMVTPAAVPSPLPDIRDVHLVLSSVEKSLMKEACQVAVALQPRSGYVGIAFPRGRMEAAEWRDLLHLLAAAQVRVVRRGGVEIPEETITVEEERELRNLADTLWGCWVWRYPDEACFLPYLPVSECDRMKSSTLKRMIVLFAHNSGGMMGSKLPSLRAAQHFPWKVLFTSSSERQ
ncbi:uncharacterized protein LOC135095504 isoform X2 [Scylla paramamosain]|uniref:uncharacterized protein LOC135095504 isoform X2 n=1 Tax=Scylla paramamosain TaxID=85552 RepID=UPI00308333B8